MQNRRDQVHAYRFSVSRLCAAVAGDDPSSGEPPFRRASLGVLAGTLIAGLLCGGAVVWGHLSPASAGAWRREGAVILAEETRTRDVYLDGWPVPPPHNDSPPLGARNPALGYLPRGALGGI